MQRMDVSIAVPSPRVHGDAVAPSASFALPAQASVAEQNQAPTTLVHARLDARDVTASASDSGQEDEDSHCSSRPPSPKRQRQSDDDDAPPRDEEMTDDHVERFDGKIVYNPDGSAYIIDDDDCPVPLPKVEGAIVDRRRGPSSDPLADPVPQIASALYVSRQSHLFQSGKSASSSASCSEGAPVMHSFRVYSARRPLSGVEPPPIPAEAIQTGSIPFKPILMCFVCKLSFGSAKTLAGHSTAEHGVRLDDEEKRILSQPNTSAILQLVGKNKEPVVSFLEPVRAGVMPVQQGSATHQLNTSNSSSGNSSSQTPTNELELESHAKTEPAHDESFETRETVVSGRPESSTPPVSSHIVHGAPAPVSTNNGRPSSPSASPSPLSPPTHPLASPVNMAAVAAAAAAAAAAAGFGHPFAQSPGAFAGADASLLSPALTSSAAAAMALASRNSCKTLKCPKCNWHYKYQETLEIHMKEKHPESETSCIYCLTGQAHPRLARGETYTCGYKPYRCDVCNYSTTTKGNLSIHMQSDKHLNNAQELQNSAAAAAAAAATSAHNTSAESLSSSPNKNSSGSSANLHASPSPSGGPVVAGLPSPASKSASSGGAKPSFRCDVCNYETNVGRNLRIHMTSEKHTHNMIMLQQNVKRMQQLSALSAQQGMDPSAGAGGAEAALADMAYQQALFIQMMTGGQLPSSQPDPMTWPGNMAAGPGSPMQDPGLNPETMEPPPEPMEPNPQHAFQCLVCSVFCAESAESLAAHVAADRSRQREHEALLLIGGHYLCRLCAYKTTLKANFQLHCKTDKHLQRLQHATHIQEGGPRNDWKLQYVTSTTNPVQLRCNVCEYYTNSVHKMQVHSAQPRHQLALDLFRYLSDEAASLGNRGVQFQCRLCQFESPSKTTLMQHARSLRHCQLEQLAELQRRGAANGKEVAPLEMRDLFAATPASPDSDQDDAAAVNESSPSANGTDGAGRASSPAEQKEITAGDDSAPSASSGDARTGNVANRSSESGGPSCPLCQNRFADRGQLEQHAASAHSVNAEGLERLMLLVEQSGWLAKQDEPASGDESESTPVARSAAGIPPATVSERHAYKYRCPQCSLAFKTLDKLQLHSQYHVIRDATKCPLCGRSFRSILSLQKHLEGSHAELTDEEANVLRQSLLSHPLLLSGLAGQASEAAISDYLRREQAAAAELSGGEEEEEEGNATAAMDADANEEVDAQEEGDANESKRSNDGQPQGTPLEEYLNSPAVAEETYADPARKFKCHRCKMAFTSQSYLTSHNKTMQHRKGEKLNYPMEKYLDPNRPFKCDVCKESFTQKNILLVHYNSVSHLHKLKRAAAAGNADSAPSTPTPLNRPERPVTANSTSSVASDSAAAANGKPWKCNICKVAYSQGSTLDIHLRSVLHQTRASKLQELAAAGQIDLTRPLIEQPSASSPESPVARKPDANLDGAQQQQQQLALALGQLYGLSAEQILQQQQHQQLVQQYYQAAGIQVPDNWPVKAGSDPSESPTAPPDESVNNNKVNVPARRSSRMLKHLLGSYGFELVMQFNECHQKQRASDAKAQQADSQPTSAEANSLLNASAISDPAEEENKENAVETDGQTGDKAPEVQRCVCPLCHKSFSSIWVLKAHSEEVHRQMVPPHCVEQCADELKRSANLSTTPANNAPPLSPVERLPPPGNIDRPENPPEQEVSAKPESIPTPTASSTPISNNESAAQNAAQQALAQQMSDMQGVLNAMGLASQLQQQFNPMMMGLAGLGLPAAGLGFNMPAAALAAMNMQPQLMNPFMMAGHFDPIQAAMAQAAAAQGNPFLQQAVDPSGMLAKQQQLLQQQQQQSGMGSSSNVAANGGQQGGQQQKRARTRITDEQLKILRAHFDINNSPSEETIAEMARQSGLPPKVIKHWFRNTLFKERQRNKDSPYNFSNPPSTTLNLEEYEKTGEAKVTQLKTEEQLEIQRALLATRPQPTTKSKSAASSAAAAAPCSAPATPEVAIKKEAETNEASGAGNDEANRSTPGQAMPTTPGHPFHMRSGSPMTNLSLASLISSQLNVDTKNLGPGAMFPPRPATSNSALPSPAAAGVNLAGLSPGRLNSDQGPFNFFTTSTPLPMAPLTPPGGSGSGNNSSGGGPGSSTGKRANRTRFTDYQIKVLQEFFENNAYPKDDDLEYLSKLLSLSPRVIVVWFQNARQKARKVYENQPPVAGAADPSSGSPAAGTDDGTGRFQRTPGLNYQCKKCLLVFQRYYELIRHQKTHCFKEEDAKRSAVAQAAAAQAAACFSSSDNDNSNSSSLADAGAVKASPVVKAEPRDSTPAPPPPKQPELFQATPQQPPAAATPTQSQQQQQQQQNDSAFHCEQCGLTFSRFDLWREHQIVHIMNPDLFGGSGVKLPPGMENQYAALLQQHQAAVVAAAAAQLQASLPANSAGSSGQMTPPASTGIASGSKRKHDDEEEERNTGSGAGSAGNESNEGQPRDKRLRTTILPEQLDFLYQQYQLESNPSRKMLETISREVGLKKRVVQVWFQNTRARERKGQFRAHAQVINKRCPFCPALFKVKSALESHLASRHPDQLAKGDVNIDALPDMTDEDSDTGVNSSSGVGSSGAAGETNSAAAIQEALTKRLSAVSNYQQSMASLSMLSSLYSQGFVAPLAGFEGGKAEDALKRYANDYLAAAAASNAGSSSASSTPAPASGNANNAGSHPTGEAPLDLSRPLPGVVGQMRPESSMQSDMGGDDTRSEHYMDYFDESNPSSPLPFKLNQSGSGAGSSGAQSGQAKRFRTQMSAVQVRVMKSLFSDYKTPTMAECEALGREIGLPKRVVQVWFQNARAKEKKSKLNAQKAAGDLSGGDSGVKQPEGCELCDFKYSHKYAVQDHIFTHQHIERVKQHVAEQTGKHADDAAPSRPKSSSHADNQEPSTSSSTPTPGASAGENASPESAQLEALLLHQLYGLGYGAAGMPAAALAAAAAAAAASFNNQQQPGNMAAAAGQSMWGQGGENYMLAMLQRSPAALQQIAKTFNEPGVSEARFTLDGSSRSSLNEHLSQSEQKLIRSHSTDVGVLCKACQTLYGSEAAVVQHQRAGCPQTAESSSSSGGATRLVMLQYDCVACDEKVSTLAELRNHLNGDGHRRAATKLVNGEAELPPTSASPSSGLNSQIEDVVKQLTALAQATGSGPTGAPSFGAKTNSGDCDTNANIAQRKAATYGQ